MAPTDPLSDVLRALRPTGGVFLDARLSAPSLIAAIPHILTLESEEAFSRAFKREFGVPSARWRDQLPSHQALS
jgi:hypothetical protein